MKTVAPLSAGLWSCSESFLLPNPSKAPTAHTTTTSSISRAKHGVVASTNANNDKPTQEWDVARYRDQHSFVYEYGTSLVDLLQAQPGERILNIGCGSGELTAAIAESVAGADDTWSKNSIEAVGFDSDPSMVQKAQEQYPDLTFFQGDARNFTVDEPFDAIFSNAALHWVPTADVERSVVAISKALKVGGRFLVEFGGKGNVQQIVQATQEQLPGIIESPWYFPSIVEYSSLLENHGIEVISAMLFDRPTPLENGDEGLRNWIRCFGVSFFEGQSEEDVDRLLDRIEMKLRPQLYDEQKHLWTADYRRIRITGKRIS